MFELKHDRAEQILEDYLRKVGLFLTRPLLTKEEGVEYTKHVAKIFHKEGFDKGLQTAMRQAGIKEALRKRR